MAVDYQFVKSVLREYTAEERAAISQIAEKECRLDGVVDTMSIWGIANTYMAIYKLAIGDSTQERVGGLSRSRTKSEVLAEQYRQSYLALARREGLSPRVFPTDEATPSLPVVFI